MGPGWAMRGRRRAQAGVGRGVGGWVGGCRLGVQGWGGVGGACTGCAARTDCEAKAVPTRAQQQPTVMHAHNQCLCHQQKSRKAGGLSP